MVVELGSENTVFAQTTNSYLCKRKICICANAESVFVQPWRAVFAHSSPHCPLTPCQRWNTNIEQAKNEKSSILACPQEAIHPLKFIEHLFEPISGKKLLRNIKYMTKSNPFINKLYPLTKPWTLPRNGMGSIETEQFYLNFKFTSSLINSLRHKKQGKFALRCSSANWNGIFDKKLRNFNIRQSLTKNSAGSGFSHLQQVIRATINAICLDSNQKSVRINERKYISFKKYIFF